MVPGAHNKLLVYYWMWVLNWGFQVTCPRSRFKFWRMCTNESASLLFTWHSCPACKHGHNCSKFLNGLWTSNLKTSAQSPSNGTSVGSSLTDQPTSARIQLATQSSLQCHGFNFQSPVIVIKNKKNCCSRVLRLLAAIRKHFGDTIIVMLWYYYSIVSW